MTRLTFRSWIEQHQKSFLDLICFGSFGAEDSDEFDDAAFGNSDWEADLQEEVEKLKQVEQDE